MKVTLNDTKQYIEIHGDFSEEEKVIIESFRKHNEGEFRIAHGDNWVSISLVQVSKIQTGQEQLKKYITIPAKKITLMVGEFNK